jgi:hypothetical protein
MNIFDYIYILIAENDHKIKPVQILFLIWKRKYALIIQTEAITKSNTYIYI